MFDRKAILSRTVGLTILRNNLNFFAKRVALLQNELLAFLCKKTIFLLNDTLQRVRGL